jgi:hypothetical protein
MVVILISILQIARVGLLVNIMETNTKIGVAKKGNFDKLFII